MTYLVATLLVVVNLAWLALNIFQLPGNWMIVATTGLVAWWQWDEGMFSVWTLAAVLVLAVIGEVLEFFAGVAGTSRAGGTRHENGMKE